MVCLFESLAAFQTLSEKRPDNVFFWNSANSKSIRLAMYLGAFYTALQSFLLLQIRAILYIPQLRSVCAYMFLWHIMIHFLEMPVMGKFLQQQLGIAPLLVRLCLIVNHLGGFIGAGKAEGVSKILTSEKED